MTGAFVTAERSQNTKIGRRIIELRKCVGLESRTSLPISEGVAVVSVVLFKKMGREFWRNDGETDSAINALRMQSGGWMGPVEMEGRPDPDQLRQGDPALAQMSLARGRWRAGEIDTHLEGCQQSQPRDQREREDDGRKRK